MDSSILLLPDAPLPLDPDSYYEVLVPDSSSATGYTSCKIKPSNLTGVKRYKALISQSSTSAPTVKILENSIGSIVWTRSSTGEYYGTLAGVFTTDKVFFIIGQHPPEQLVCQTNSVDDVYITTSDSSGTASDDLLIDTPILIEVYP